MRRIFAGALLAATTGIPALAASSVPVTVRSQGDLDTCIVGQVAGLNPAGDNFLAVRAGPGSDYAMLDKLRGGQEVWIFEERGGWYGVAYGAAQINCSPVARDRAYDGPGRSGWVSKRYVREVAG
ncbi:MAG: SH3 domain-containing protein [Hyphomicrobiales bacterium]